MYSYTKENNMIVKCKCCNVEFEKAPSQIKKCQNNFCSRSCAAKVNNTIKPKRKKYIRYCQSCGSNIKGLGKKYCNIKCQKTFQLNQKVQLWKFGNDAGYDTNGTIRRYIKKYILIERGTACEQCGWNKINPRTNKCPLEIHHRDGNYKNNKEDNLQILCPNCHSLTNTYKNLNKGNGRKYRK